VFFRFFKSFDTFNFWDLFLITLLTILIIMTTTVDSTKRKWYDYPVLVLLLYFLFFPVGLYGLWKSKKIAKGLKIAGTAFWALLLILIIAAPDDLKKVNTATQKTSEEKPVSKPEQEKSSGQSGAQQVNSTSSNPPKQLDSTPSIEAQQATLSTPSPGGKKDRVTYYSSVEEMIEDYNTVSKLDGTFKMISKKPLSIQVSALGEGFKNHIDKLQKMSAAVAIRIILEIFATTTTQEVTISSIPIIEEDFENKKFKYDPAGGIIGTIKKDKAKAVMYKETGLSNFEDLFGLEQNGSFYKDSPNEYFDKLAKEETAVRIFKEMAGR